MVQHPWVRSSILRALKQAGSCPFITQAIRAGLEQMEPLLPTRFTAASELVPLRAFPSNIWGVWTSCCSECLNSPWRHGCFPLPCAVIFPAQSTEAATPRGISPRPSQSGQRGGGRRALPTIDDRDLFPARLCGVGTRETASILSSDRGDRNSVIYFPAGKFHVCGRRWF